MLFSCSFGGIYNRLAFNDGYSFLCLLPLDGLVLDELSFGIHEEYFIKTIRTRKTMRTIGEVYDLWSLCDTAVRTAGHFARFTPDSDFFHHTFCTERRRRPHVDAFADLTPIDESTLIERSQLLDAIADDDDIEWKCDDAIADDDPFEMRPESANPETPDEIIAMIIFAGSPELQEQLRSLCR